MTVTRRADLDFTDYPGRESADPLATGDAASSARVVRLRRERGRSAHRHPHSEEVVYVIAGSGYVWIDGARHPVAAGDVVHIPQGATHATVPDEGIDMELMCFFPHPNLAQNLEETDTPVGGG
ncbi:MAG: cupin domain-containing protein [Acidimicrobiia bacterium]|nr:cupin domain-containing protein [Acidimicrobiia bacterium]